MKPTHQEFIEWRAARRGSANPEIMTNPYWDWGVKHPKSAYGMAEEFEELEENWDDEDGEDEAGWCFERYGQTKTTLKDGSVVYIAGEHEDFYDPDFFIYNDVVVVAPDGKIAIYGYSEEHFPATDFHTATLLNDEIILIGSLSYPQHRHSSQTQVLILDTNDWSIRSQETSHSPGWISHHAATHDAQDNVIRITNIQKWTEEKDLADEFSTWELDLYTWQWKCIEIKNWCQYRLSRKDGEMNNLWQIRSNESTKGLNLDLNSDLYSSLEDDEFDEETLAIMKESLAELQEDTSKALSKAKPELLDTVYHPSVDFVDIPRPEIDYDAEDADEQEELIDKTYPYNHHRIQINDVQVCFIEDINEVIMRIEGELDEETTSDLLKSILKNLSKLEGVNYRASKL